VAARQQAYHKTLDHVFLADDPAADLAHYFLNHRCISGCNGVSVHVLLIW
jgi:hypothetical protein